MIVEEEQIWDVGTAGEEFFKLLALQENVHPQEIKLARPRNWLSYSDLWQKLDLFLVNNKTEIKNYLLKI